MRRSIIRGSSGRRYFIFAAYRGRSRRSKWKTREKIWTERRGWRASPLDASLDYFAMAQSTPSDLYFRNRSAKAGRPNGINSTGQVLQFPRKRDNAGHDASLQRGVIVVPSKWTVYRWIGRLPLEVPSRAVCAYAQGRNSSLYLSPSLSNSSPLTLSAARCRAMDP